MAKQKIRIKIKSFDHKVIDEAARLIIETAEKTGAIVMGPIPLPTNIDRFTVNKSTFVHKNSREQYEMRTHTRLIDITETTPATIEQLSNLSLPSGVDIEIKMIMEQGEGEVAKPISKSTKKEPSKNEAAPKKTVKKASTTKKTTKKAEK
jgi:small subunit ribosomal protein S10